MREAVRRERWHGFSLSQPREQEAPLLGDEAKLAALPQGCKVMSAERAILPRRVVNELHCKSVWGRRAESRGD
jgi:hypothetical protein